VKDIFKILNISRKFLRPLVDRSALHFQCFEAGTRSRRRRGRLRRSARGAREVPRYTAFIGGRFAQIRDCRIEFGLRPQASAADGRRGSSTGFRRGRSDGRTSGFWDGARTQSVLNLVEEVVLDVTVRDEHVITGTPGRGIVVPSRDFGAGADGSGTRRRGDDLKCAFVVAALEVINRQVARLNKAVDRGQASAGAGSKITHHALNVCYRAGKSSLVGNCGNRLGKDQCC
jgi:hypothetical protein